MRRAALGASAALLLLGCGIDTGDAARRDAARALRCPRETVEMEQTGAYRYVGRGCGREVVVTCTASQLEPSCVPHDEIASAGGRDEGEDEAAPEVDEEPDPEIEARIRAGLDARRDDVLACAGRSPVAVRVAYAPDGSVDLTLQGELSGSAQQRCVQDALDGVRVAASGRAGVVVHLVR